MSYDFAVIPVDSFHTVEQPMVLCDAMYQGPEGDPRPAVVDLIDELDRRDAIGDAGFLSVWPIDADARGARPTSDQLSTPGEGTVQCSGQQPNPCVYTPASGPAAIYSPESGEVVAPDGSKFTITNSSNTGDDGWKDMLAPVGQPSP